MSRKLTDHIALTPRKQRTNDKQDEVLKCQSLLTVKHLVPKALLPIIRGHLQRAPPAGDQLFKHVGPRDHFSFKPRQGHFTHEKIKQEEETEKYKLFLKQGVCVNINSSFILDPTFESI